jgi:hypothetical protein
VYHEKKELFFFFAAALFPLARRASVTYNLSLFVSLNISASILIIQRNFFRKTLFSDVAPGILIITDVLNFKL